MPPGLYLDPSNGTRGPSPLSALGPLGGLGRLGEFANVVPRLLRLPLTLPLGLALIKCESELDREGIVGDVLFFQAFWNERGWVGAFNGAALSGVITWGKEELPGCWGWVLGSGS